MILDGWGNSPDPKVSAIDNADTNFIDSLYKNILSQILEQMAYTLAFLMAKWVIVKLDI